MVRYTVHFAGRVQGVGFRYTAHELARGFAVAGYVENLPDRRVRLVAEGEKAELDGLLAAILKRMSGYVREHTVAEEPATGEFGEPGVEPLRIRR